MIEPEEELLPPELEDEELDDELDDELDEDEPLLLLDDTPPLLDDELLLLDEEPLLDEEELLLEEDELLAAPDEDELRLAYTTGLPPCTLSPQAAKTKNTDKTGTTRHQRSILTTVQFLDSFCRCRCNTDKLCRNTQRRQHRQPRWVIVGGRANGLKHFSIPIYVAGFGKK